MKSSDLKLGVEYAVIPCWQYSSADKKDASRVQRGSVMKAVLVSLDKYEYQVYRSVDVSDPNFIKRIMKINSLFLKDVTKH